MFRKRLFAFCLLSLLLIPMAAAQDDKKPTIGILRFGTITGLTLTEYGILEALELYDFISAEERAQMAEYQDLEGEKVNIIWGNANFDISSINLILEDMLDQDVDALVTISTPVTQAAVNVTSNMDDPPAVLFTAVYSPYKSGIADSSCIKPDHVTGVETRTPYENIISLLLLQNPDMKKIGIIYSSLETSGVFGAEEVSEISESLGLTIESIAVSFIPDIPLAAEGLIAKGIEAFLIPMDTMTTRGLPLLVQTATTNNVPIFHSTLGGIFSGATVSAGSTLYYLRGVNLGYILAAHLNGELDIATAGIQASDFMYVGINMNMARAQNIEISEALMAEADVVLEAGGGFRVAALSRMGGQATITIAEEFRVLVDILGRSGQFPISPEIAAFLERLPPYDYEAGGEAFLESILCTPERIAEEQAELDASSE